MTKEVIIDGSMGEGGGQILRTTIGLAAVLGIPVKIVNIRAKRSRPGLQRQHLTAVKAVATICNAKVKGAYLGSMTLEFIPSELRGGRFRFDIGTAGSISLVIQALMPVLFFVPNPIEIEIRGGTDVPWSPPIDYVRFVLAPLLRKLGLDINITLKRRGHYPRGGGIVTISVHDPPKIIKPIKAVERGDIKRIEGLSHCVKLPAHVSVRQAKAAEKIIRSQLPDVPVKISLEYYDPERDPHLGPGSGIVLWAITDESIIGGDSLGAKGKPAEKVGEEAAKKLLEDLATGMAFDRHLSDMIIPLLALASGESLVGGAKLTLHAETNIELVKILVGSDTITLLKGESDKPFILRVKGVALSK